MTKGLKPLVGPLVNSIRDASNSDNFEYEAHYDNGTELTFIRSKRTDGHGKIVVRSPIGSKREYYFFTIPKKYQPVVTEMKRMFGYPEILMPMPEMDFMRSVDWRAFRAQKAILNTMAEVGLMTDSERAVLNAYVTISDEMQDFAVDHLGIPAEDVFTHCEFPTHEAPYVKLYQICTPCGTLLDAAETLYNAERIVMRLKDNFGIDCTAIPPGSSTKKRR